MRWVLLALFVATYAGIAARRLYLLPVGRPSAALVGACAMVAVGLLDRDVGLTTEEALRAVEPNTMVLLFGMMLLSAALGYAGFFDLIVGWLAARRPSATKLLYATTIGCGLLSAVLVNDAVCLLATPVVLALVDRLGAARAPFLFAVAMGSNAGSALTLGGNPQNMLVAKLGGLAYRAYTLRVAPGAFAALLATAAIVHWMHRAALASATATSTATPTPTSTPTSTSTSTSTPTPTPTSTPTSTAIPTQPLLLRASLAALLGVTVANVAGAHLAASAVTGAAFALVFARRDAPKLLERVDWSVLVFFGSLFVVVAAFQKTGLATDTLSWLTARAPMNGGRGTLVLTLILSVGSQIVSNVPLILLLEPWIRTLGDPTFVWTVTALATTLAGNLTLLGSVANVIVVEQAHARGAIGFLAYAKVGIPVTIVSTALAVGFVVLTK